MMHSIKQPKIKNDINGILLLDKAMGLTSNGALQRVKRLFSARKAGHTGSLDPLATGMLPICFGEATKFSQFLLESDKHYSVTAKLGVQTTTGDAEGEVIKTQDVSHITFESINRVLKNFEGPIQQIPPMYSAIKHKGRPLYELARKGIEVERSSRQVTIYSLTCTSYENDEMKLEVHCSKGTYIRTLIEDIAEKLHGCAHVIGLRRGFVAPYSQSNMVTFELLERELAQNQSFNSISQFLLPVETAVQALPALKLSASLIFYMRTGQPIMVPHAPTQGLVGLFADHGVFLGVGEIMDDGRVAPKRLVVGI